jgi:L-ascorbate metabolism protein UlaG (beta-lactamase superfamily)
MFLVFGLMGLFPLQGEEEKENVKPEEQAPEVEKGVRLDWFGHNFLYVTSTSGVRMALDPFEREVMDYTLPAKIPADIVLISCESPDRSGSKEIFGLPQVFRSLAGLGRNQANGIQFYGYAAFRDGKRGMDLGKNTVYTFEMDHIRFCHLGGIGHALTQADARKIGKVDVLFLPIGSRILSNEDLWKNAELLQAKWILPVAYKTGRTRNYDLRSLSEWPLEGRKVVQAESSHYVFLKEQVPTEPTVLVLKSP